VETNTPITRAWFDGSLAEDGRAAFGYVVAQAERVVATCGGVLESCPGVDQIDSMATEFAALDATLRHLIATGTGGGPIVVCGDCAPVLTVAQGYKGIADRYQVQTDRIAAMLMLLPPVTFEWVPRSRNTQAHVLARTALLNHRDMKPGQPPAAASIGAQTGNAKGKRRFPKLRRMVRKALARMCDHI
jgi:hypothetical protein